MWKHRTNLSKCQSLPVIKQKGVTQSNWVTAIQIKPITKRGGEWGVIPGQDGSQTCRSEEDLLLLGCDTREGPLGVGDGDLTGRRTGWREIHTHWITHPGLDKPFTSSGGIESEVWQGGGLITGLIHIDQLNVGVGERAPSGRGVGTGRRLHQLTAGVRGRVGRRNHISLFKD